MEKDLRGHSDFALIKPSRASSSHSERLLEQLQAALLNYMHKRPYLSLSAISRKCRVSEPTLRRVRNQEFRTAPTPSTVVNLLSYISGESSPSINRLQELYGGAIADYLAEQFSASQDAELETDPELIEALRDNTTYAIFKLCLNTGGVSKKTLQRLFGEAGLYNLESLISQNFVLEKEGRYFAKVEWLALPGDLTKEKFAYLAQFIKTSSNDSDPLLSPRHCNYSCAISPSAYKEISKLQSRFLKKVREIISNDENQGNIPLLLLSALDTLDTKLPDEDFLKD